MYVLQPLAALRIAARMNREVMHVVSHADVVQRLFLQRVQSSQHQSGASDSRACRLQSCLLQLMLRVEAAGRAAQQAPESCGMGTHHVRHFTGSPGIHYYALEPQVCVWKQALVPGRRLSRRLVQALVHQDATDAGHINS